MAPSRGHERGGATNPRNPERDRAMLGTVLIIVLVLVLVGVLPTWDHSRAWGYGPSGTVGLIVVILLVLVLTGRL